MEKIKCLARAHVKNADTMLSKNLSKEQSSYFMGAKFVAEEVLKAIEQLEKKEYEEFLEIMGSVPRHIEKDLMAQVLNNKY